MAINLISIPIFLGFLLGPLFPCPLGRSRGAQGFYEAAHIVTTELVRVGEICEGTFTAADAMLKFGKVRTSSIPP